eukprot:CAMPEP_0201547958 /NCGR_PEP_ID=MMETSP0173_2-20130828/4445_1 /ASSEMBLY_ACC=CAM_ASM_000268 /TAXON_ID=218659 /ORGANISM="Vexillifera sp., Strain DIVA3 564/2" /LENGTH=145 /DNA_ID=CAMNT_0047957157 /DNA_START=153 /DNA_END=590 /DNA_ORIENTATION=-
MASSSTRRAATVKDVSSEKFIAAYAEHLKKSGKLEIPSWVDIVKTSSSKELSPLNDDWYYIRAASIARKIYLRPGTGVGALRRIYGGSYRRGTRTNAYRKASGGVIRHVLQQLEKQNLIKKGRSGGRRISSRGQRDLDRIAGTIA